MPIAGISESPSSQQREELSGKNRARWSLIGMGAFILLLHVAGWGTLLGIVTRQHLSIGNSVFGFGIGLAAYALGMRHAFDADHIAAIDNTTRKIMQTGKRPLSVGFWFSFGHSTVVFILALLLAFGVKSIAAPVLDDKSQLHQVTGLIGTIVSSGFLYLIAIFNLVVLLDIIRVFRQMRRGQWAESASDTHHVRGIMSTLLRRVMKFVNEPWQMYFVGLLFGLGFDTATEIALLVLTGSGAASGLPWYAILCLPVLFAAGMSLFDTIDGSFMTIVYAWALTKPVRRVYYNLIITGLSIAVALVIGTIEIMGLLGDKLDLHGAVWDWVRTADLGSIGFVIVGLFVVTWVVAAATWKWGRIEDRLTAP